MSVTLFDADEAVAYEPPPDLPIDVLSVGYGEATATPSVVDTVEVVWQYRGRPGTFETLMEKVGDWRGSLDAVLRLRVWQVENVYNALGGYPPPTPLPDVPTPGPGVVYSPDLPPGYILPPGVIGIE